MSEKIESKEGGGLRWGAVTEDTPRKRHGALILTHRDEGLLNSVSMYGVPASEMSHQELEAALCYALKHPERLRRIAAPHADFRKRDVFEKID